MKSELLSLSRLFSETIFRIPDYQRGYAWTDKQLRDFWNDVEQIEPGKNHYIGVLTVEEVPRHVYERWDDDLWIIQSKRYAPLHVVDGQQRLTTAMILVQCILERLADGERLNHTLKDDIRKKFVFESVDDGISRSYLFGYEKDNPSYEFLKREIFMERSDAHSVVEETIYTKNLRAAKAYFTGKLEGLPRPALEKVFTTLTQHFLFNSYVISNDIDVFVAFETMNNRGKPLSVLELLKNRLIYLSTKLPVPQPERDKLRATVNECWKTAYHFLGLAEQLRVDDDVFLQRHYWLYFGAREVSASPALPLSPPELVKPLHTFKNAFNESLLESHFIVKNLREPPEKPMLDLSLLYEYAHSIKAYVSVDYNISNPYDSTYTKAEQQVLARLEKIVGDMVGEGLRLLVLAVYTYSGRISTADRVRIVQLVENILFVGSLGGWWRMEDVESPDARTLAVALAARAIDAKEVIRRLEGYVRERNTKIVPQRLVGWWATKPLGYYQWRSLAYFMFEYEQHLRDLSKNGREKLHWQQLLEEEKSGDYASIEHILPQQVTDPYWKAIVKDYSVKERNSLKHSLGNLVPLSKPKNSSLSNKSFLEKKGTPLHPVGFSYGCYAENEIAHETNWTAQHIRDRGVRLLGFMEKRWQIPLGSDRDKIKLLGLEFVK